MSAGELLAAFRRGGVLAPGDADVAAALARMVGEDDPLAALGAALAVRGPRVGHVCVDLERVAGHVVVDAPDAEPAALPWPEPGRWRDALAASPLVGDASAARPLVLRGSRLYLDRYWRYERRLAAGLRARVAARPVAEPERLRAALDRLLPRDEAAEADWQRVGVAAGASGGLTVLTGGPGTGKTTVVARLLALLLELAEAPLRVGLAAPTGKAAARLGEAVGEAAAALPVPPRAAESMAALRAETLHRLLGPRRDAPTRFRHHRGHPLPLDVVVVDEASMVPLALMAKLVDAVADDARLVLVGDHDQLASVEAGAVLGDLCAADGGRSPQAARRLAEASGEPVEAEADRPGIGDAVVRLRRFHRFGEASPLGRLAQLLRDIDDDPAPALAWLDGAGAGDDAAVTWERSAGAGDRLLDDAVAHARQIAGAASAGDAGAALEALAGRRVLCAHRRGRRGAAALNDAVLARLAAEDGVDVEDPWCVGHAVMVTENDDAAGLRNGDVGVVVADPDVPGGRSVAFAAVEGGLRRLAPSRVPAVETAYATTVHKAQGSQFDHAVVVLPERDSPVCSRELVYTGVTRARRRLTLWADPEVLAGALARRVQRPSGLADALRPAG